MLVGGQLVGVAGALVCAPRSLIARGQLLSHAPEHAGGLYDIEAYCRQVCYSLEWRARERRKAVAPRASEGREGLVGAG